MSEASSSDGFPPFKASNTVESMEPMNMGDFLAERAGPTEESTKPVEVVLVDDFTDDPLDDENTFDVNRAEFEELRDAFLRLISKIENYNLRAPHKIE